MPVEVQVVAERYSKKRRCISGFNRDIDTHTPNVGNNDVVMDMYTTCCKRECIEDFHRAGQERATSEVAQLIEFIQNMPAGPQKTHFLKKVWKMFSIRRAFKLVKLFSWGQPTKSQGHLPTKNLKLSGPSLVPTRKVADLSGGTKYVTLTLKIGDLH